MSVQIVWGDTYENDPDGAWITWGDGTGLAGGWGADITPPSRATVHEDPALAQEGSKYLEIYLADASTDAGEIGCKYGLIMSPRDMYESLITDGMYVSWWMKLLQYLPASWGKIFHFGRYTGAALQRMSFNLNQGSGAIGIANLYIDGVNTSRSSTGVIPLNEWHKYAAAIFEDPVSGYYKAWMDDAPILDVSNINNVPPDGMGNYQFELGFDYFGNQNYPANLYIHLDDIQVGNYVADGIPKHTLTVNSEGLLGVPFEVRRLA